MVAEDVSEAAVPRASFAPGRYASIDIGTVTCRMLVADVTASGELHELARTYAITNLGEGVAETRRLKPAAIERVVQAVEGFLEVLAPLSASAMCPVRPRAVSTSAARDADNAHELVRRFSDVCVDLHIISGEREAILSFAGVSAVFTDELLVAVDVGGGSTEAVVGRAGEGLRSARSFDIGCRRVTERFLASDPPAACELDRARSWMRGSMAPYFADLRTQGLLEGRMVAVAGTATTVVSVRDRMAVYDAARVHRAQVTRRDIDGVLAQLAGLPLAERRGVTGLDPDRAPVIVAGIAILRETMDLGGFESFTVSESDILHGVILDAASVLPGQRSELC